MEPVITVDGNQFNPTASDGTGYDAYDQNGLALTGWYGSPAKRVTTSPQPYASGSYASPGYDDARTIGVGGTVIAPDRLTLLQMQRSLSTVCSDPNALYAFQVVDDLGSLFCLVRRVGAVLIKPVSSTVSQYSLSFIAPDPRLLDTNVQSITTPLAQTSGVSGVAYRGAAGSNLLTNPAFESNVSSWTVAGGTAVQSTTQAHGGTHAAKLTPNGTSGSTTFESEKHAVVAGQMAAVSAWVWFTNAVTATFSLSVNWYNAANTLLSTTTANVSVTAAAWTQVSNNFQAPFGATQVSIVPTLSGTPAAGQLWYVDDASLAVGTNTAFRGPAGTTGLSFGARGPSGIVNLDNTAGTAEADIVFTIRGPVMTPSVSTATDWLTYNGSLGASDVLTIDTGSGAVLLNGVNRRPLLTRASFFRIPEATALNVRFSSTDTSNTIATLTAAWRRTYL